MKPDELLPGLTYREFLAEALRHRTEERFRASPFFARHGAGLEAMLLRPRITRAERTEGPATPESDGLRVAHWNIEKGRRFDGIARRLREDSWLRAVDLLTLNEVDDGTARGGNRDQAAELAGLLNATAVYQPCWIECTRGVGPDLEVPGEHLRGLQGSAVVTRLPVVDARAVPLPVCFDTFDFHEKRFGGRRALFVRLLRHGRPLVVGTTHLEVRQTPKCRALQFRALLHGLDDALRDWFGAAADPGAGRGARFAGAVPVILTGDWNTNTFRRGAVAPSIREFLRIVSRSRERLAAETAWPVAREPLFAELAAAGFGIDGANEAVPTAAQDLGKVEDLGRLPPILARWLSRAAGFDGREVRMRLDWIAARGLRPAAPPVTLPAGEERGVRLSDHAIVGADFV